MNDIQFVLVRRDSLGKTEILKKEKFDSTGYSFLKIREMSDGSVEEWVETEKFEMYQKMEKTV